MTERDFGVYIHVPFCTVRCGYCDFNTYAPSDAGHGSRQDYVIAALAEMAWAGASMADDPRPVSTVFFGGGTPTILDTDALARMLAGVRQTWSLTPDAEVTTEANPDSVGARSLEALAGAGFTRVSLGMQSAVPEVLATLERTHRPDNVAMAVRAARDAGLGTSVDLIYGTPGETLDQWRRSLEAAIELEPDHLSAYALVIEPGTKMGSQLRRGQIDAVDADLQADMYELADELLGQAGYRWYEVSNWARTPADQCRHNVGYWTSQDWWGIGPGAHSYLGPGIGRGTGARRWWNVKLPRVYAARMAAGEDPAAEVEPLSEQDLLIEAVMLRLRLAEGVPVADLPEPRGPQVAALIADGVLDGGAALRGTLQLTLRGRLLADAAVRVLT